MVEFVNIGSIIKVVKKKATEVVLTFVLLMRLKYWNTERTGEALQVVVGEGREFHCRCT